MTVYTFTPISLPNPEGGGFSSYILVCTDVLLEWGTFLTSQIYQLDAIFINLLCQWVDNFACHNIIYPGIYHINYYDWVRIFNGNIWMCMVFKNIEYLNGGGRGKNLSGTQKYRKSPPPPPLGFHVNLSSLNYVVLEIDLLVLKKMFFNIKKCKNIQNVI